MKHTSERTVPSSDADREHAAAVTELYRLFAHRRDGYREWLDMDLPAYRVDLPERGDVRTLRVADYQDLSWHALCCDGGEPATVKYFLPRILDEWLPQGPQRPVSEVYTGPCKESSVDDEMFVSYLNKTRWQTWPAEERDAVERFFLAALRRALNQRAEERHQRRPEDFTRLALFAGVAVEDVVAAWNLDAADVNAIAHLGRLAEGMDRACAGKKNVRYAWTEQWGNAGVAPETTDRLIDALTDDKTRARIERLFFASEDADVQTTLSVALTAIDTLRGLWLRAVATRSDDARK